MQFKGAHWICLGENGVQCWDLENTVVDRPVTLIAGNCLTLSEQSWKKANNVFTIAQQPLVGQDLLIIEASRSHTF